MNPSAATGVRALCWEGEIPGRLLLLDQTLLPESEVRLPVTGIDALVAAIRRLAVRGAPALGCVGAYGVVLAAQPHAGAAPAVWLGAVEQGARTLTGARPTAVNLQVGVDRVLERARELAAAGAGSPREWSAELLETARVYHREDEELCDAIGRNGAVLLGDPATVLTHCHTGALATGGSGTALSVIYAAHGLGKRIAVFADETRPLLQGARLTAWELYRAGVPVTLQCDGAAASTLASGRIDAVLVGADRIAANGDVANKIGTYALALAAHANGVPFYVAAPTTTIDLLCPDGAGIPIEQRDAGEVRGIGSECWAPQQVPVWNPAFDVTPARLVTALITEKGVLDAPDAARIAAHVARP